MKHRPPPIALRAMLLVVLASVLALAAAAGLAGPAAADVGLVSSDPADGAELSARPEQVRLMFSGELQTEFAAVVVTVNSEPIGKPRVSVAGDVVSVVFAEGAPNPAPGQAASWEVAYRVVAADGHPVTGTVEFSVDEQPGPPAAASPALTPAFPAPSSGSLGQGGEAAGSSLVSTIVIGGLAAAGALGAAMWLARARRKADAAP